jgi:hypothetical protein
VDESYDQHKFVMTGLAVKAKYWRQTFDALKTFRKDLYAKYGLRQSREHHATNFIRDCSDGISTRKLNVGDRKRIFELALRHLASLNSVRLINVCLNVNGRPLQEVHLIAIERLANRIQRTMIAKGSHAVVVIERLSGEGDAGLASQDDRRQLHPQPVRRLARRGSVEEHHDHPDHRRSRVQGFRGVVFFADVRFCRVHAPKT